MTPQAFLSQWMAAAWRDPAARVAVTSSVRALAQSLKSTATNDVAHTYTIPGFDGSPYITRTLLPRVADRRLLIHEIHREDADEWPHNHPWLDAEFMVVDGGYIDERWTLEAGIWVKTYTTMEPGSINRLEASSLHRVRDVLPGTLTVGLVGERVQDWGFLVDGAIVPHGEYFASRRYQVSTEGLS